MTRWRIPTGKQIYEADDLSSPLLVLHESPESGPVVIDERVPLQLAMTGWSPVESHDKEKQLVGRKIQWLDGGQALLTHQLIVRLSPDAQPDRLVKHVELVELSPLFKTERTYLLRLSATTFDPVTALYQLLELPDVEWAELDLLAFLDPEVFLNELTDLTPSEHR